MRRRRGALTRSTPPLPSRRQVFIAGILLFTVASLLGGFATSEAFLIAARVLQGVGAAIASPTALALVTTTFPEGPPRNRAFAVYAAMSGAGAAIGLILGGLLTEYLDWRWVLFVNVPIGLVVAFIAPRVLGESVRQTGRFDLPGALTGSAGIVLSAQLASVLAPRVAPRVTGGAGLLLTAAGLLWMARIDAGSTHVTHLLGPMLVISVGLGLTFVPLTLTALSGVAPRDSGISSGILNTMQQIGGALGLALFSTVATRAATGSATDAATGSATDAAAAIAAQGGDPTQLPPAVLAQAQVDGFTAAFLIGVVVLVVAFVIAVLSINARPTVAEAEAATVHAG